ncbi:hypothetical protein [Nostoc sp.]|uniref:hypothetical protein n=1 Tax=Nostoc sp. TaxID=1180 RepID=UPI002FF121A8
MPVWSRKVFVSTKPPTVLKGIWLLTPLGFPTLTHCTRANVSDDAGLKEKFTLNIDYFKLKQE